MTLIGPLPTPADSPKHPTPWSRDTDGALIDAKGHSVQNTDGECVEFPAPLAQAIVEAVNAHYGAAPVLRDLVDCDGDKWCEVAPGKVVMAATRENAERRIHRDDYEPRDLRYIGFQPFTDAATREIIPEHR